MRCHHRWNKVKKKLGTKVWADAFIVHFIDPSKKLRSKPECLPKIARETGLNVVTGTGYYVNSFLPGYAKHLSTHEVNELYTHVLWYR